MINIMARFSELRDACHADPVDLDDLWGRLSPVSVEDVLGHWRGGDFATGHVVSTILTKVRWHGKWFDGPLDATPIVCRDDADDLYANERAAGGGAASLWPVEFRGEVTATMVYDRLPVVDHFKRVDKDTLMGVMNGKLKAAFGISDLYYFWLERDK